MNAELKGKSKNDFEKDFIKLMNNSDFEKSMENVRKNRDIKLVTTDRTRSLLSLKCTYHKTKWFSENLLVMEIKKLK